MSGSLTPGDASDFDQWRGGIPAVDATKRAPAEADAPRPTVGRNRWYLKLDGRWEASPEVTLIEGSILRFGFGRVGNVLLEERRRARCELWPLGSSRSVRIAGGREVRPCRHQLIRQGNLRPLQFAGLPGELVQIHPQVPAVPIRKQELDVDRVGCLSQEIARGVLWVRHFREVVRRILVGEVIPPHRVVRIRGGLQFKDVKRLHLPGSVKDLS